jgi:hypothetical protein
MSGNLQRKQSSSDVGKALDGKVLSVRFQRVRKQKKKCVFVPPVTANVA